MNILHQLNFFIFAVSYFLILSVFETVDVDVVVAVAAVTDVAAVAVAAVAPQRIKISSNAKKFRAGFVC